MNLEILKLIVQLQVQKKKNADKLLVNLEKGNKEEGDKNIYFKLRILNDQESTILGRKPNWHISFHDPDLYKGKKKSSEKKGIEKKGIFHLVIGGRYFPLVFEGESYELNLKKEYGETLNI